MGADNLFTYWQPPTDAATGDLRSSWQAIRQRVSHLHVFRWHGLDRLPLAEGADLWPEVLADATPSSWPDDRVAFLEFVQGDDPNQVAADAAVLRGWLGLG